MRTHGEQVAEALGVILQRDVRRRMYTQLTEGLGEGVNESTYPVLSGLARSGPATAKELAGTVGLDRSVVSRHATALETAGLITRGTDPRDVRWTQLSLSTAGEEAVAVMRSRLTRLMDEFLEHWPADAQEQFATMMSAFTQIGPFA
ncbi:MarR family transcriptional regulator [Brevibacterium sp. 50QC2O2]|jgi:DNA-binding MarR family transcriptional regulator|uniref:MarR family winged helix-turn-helix transcriptional regulator n=1 Tax=Brevibacterium sp. 50QC2O2 TaxID=2968459 RepID=UPI00211BAA22|nr:MarR family transcriptional regulator [Brevibacterium sp. 50QC2O2]MCQ9388526.1 MarR family transcriptional regulator [Brevibacterium sp. 50QC2O2]